MNKGPFEVGANLSKNITQGVAGIIGLVAMWIAGEKLEAYWKKDQKKDDFRTIKFKDKNGNPVEIDRRTSYDGKVVYTDAFKK